MLKQTALPRSVVRAVDRLTFTFKGLDKKLVDRSKVLRQIMFAMVTRQHILLEGPPGTAKSYLAKCVFGAIPGSNDFHIQCTKKMTEDSIVGPPNVEVLRREGRMVHNTEGTLVRADFGFLDEVMDLSSGALRSLLEILNERTFSRGAQKEYSPLHTAIATTNFNRDDEEELEAVLDRFLFRSVIKPLTTTDQRREMLLASGNTEPVPTTHFKDVIKLHEAMKKVIVPNKVLDLYLAIVGRLGLTDRRVVQTLDVVRASALLSKRSTACIPDVAALGTCCLIEGNTASTKKFAKAMEHYSIATEARDKSIALTTLSYRAAELHQLAEVAQSYPHIEAVAKEARDALAAIASLSATNEEAGDLKVVLNKILSTADELYAAEAT